MDVVAFEEGLAHANGEYRAAFEAAENEQALRAANARLVGPQGSLTKLLRGMRDLPADRRKEFGARSNALKESIQEAFRARLTALEQAERML